MNNDNCLISNVGRKRDYLDSSYFCVVGNREYFFSKAKFKLFSPLLEGEDEPDGSKMYVRGMCQGILPSPGGRERGRGNR